MAATNTTKNDDRLVRFRDALVDSVHPAGHDIEDDDHENIIWYSSAELAEIEEENDFLVDNAPMLKKGGRDICWRGLEEKRKCLQFIQTILEIYEEQLKEQDWEVLRSACEKESLEAREKAQKLAHKDQMDALNAYDNEDQ